jgi:hypothetical protein
MVWTARNFAMLDQPYALTELINLHLDLSDAHTKLLLGFVNTNGS